MLSKDPKTRKLSDDVELAVGMLCMVTMNVKTEHDLANGTRGTIHDIILDSNEPDFNPQSSIIHLQNPPRVILFKPDETRAVNLPSLPEGIFPIEPATTRYTIKIGGKLVTVERRQMPVTRGYAFTDDRSQGQTSNWLNHAICGICRIFERPRPGLHSFATRFRRQTVHNSSK